VKNNFLAGRPLGSLEAIQAEARLWMDQIANVRIHGDTGKTPDELFAQESLHPLNPNPNDLGTLHTLRSNRVCRVHFDSNPTSATGRFWRRGF
jgi:hypothetical protein